MVWFLYQEEYDKIKNNLPDHQLITTDGGKVVKKVVRSKYEEMKMRREKKRAKEENKYVQEKEDEKEEKKDQEKSFDKLKPYATTAKDVPDMIDKMYKQSVRETIVKISNLLIDEGCKFMTYLMITGRDELYKNGQTLLKWASQVKWIVNKESLTFAASWTNTPIALIDIKKFICYVEHKIMLLKKKEILQEGTDEFDDWSRYDMYRKDKNWLDNYLGKQVDAATEEAMDAHDEEEKANIRAKLNEYKDCYDLMSELVNPNKEKFTEKKTTKKQREMMRKQEAEKAKQLKMEEERKKKEEEQRKREKEAKKQKRKELGKCCNKDCSKEARARCSRCKNVAYCCTACQSIDWTARHHEDCVHPEID